MDFQRILNHMNDHHHEELKGLVRKYQKIKEVNDPILTEVDFEGLNIKFNQDQNIRINFAQKANEENIKQRIIELCKDLPKD